MASLILAIWVFWG